MAARHTLASVAAALLLVAPAWAQPSGMGPGMMRDGGGPGGYGMGPGMMGGPGMGGGMMGGYGMGHGMMGGYGMGPGMMDGCGMDHGMMWGDGPRDLDLSKEQRAKISEIHRDLRRKQWELMDKMHEQAWRSDDMERDGKFDEQAARKAYDQMAAQRKQMFDNQLEARKRFDAVLTPQQREKLQRSWRGR